VLVHCLPIASPICSAGVCLVQMQRQTEAENAAAEAEQLEMQEQEWNMAELERIQEQQVWITLRFPARPAALACSWHHAWCELRLSGLGARCSLSISQSHCTIGQNPTSKRVFLAYHQASSQIGICSVCTRRQPWTWTVMQTRQHSRTVAAHTTALPAFLFCYRVFTAVVYCLMTCSLVDM